MSEQTLNAIYDILVRECGAGENLREQFVINDGEIKLPSEFRFGGSLGSGGKFYRYRYNWYVDCYAEDFTPERETIIDRTNEALEELRRQYMRENGEG